MSIARLFEVLAYYESDSEMWLKHRNEILKDLRELAEIQDIASSSRNGKYSPQEIVDYINRRFSL